MSRVPAMRPWAYLLSALIALTLSGCASLTPDGGLAQVTALAAGKSAGDKPQLASAPTANAQQVVNDLLTRPLSADAAVRIALLNNPAMHASMAQLAISDAERVQASTLPNPVLSIGRFVQGDAVEIERLLRFDVLGLVTLPWRINLRAQAATQANDMARVQAAADVVRLAADTRKAWVQAVAARMSAGYARDVHDAALAGTELARRMAVVGNWSRLQQAREQSLLAETTAQLARAEQNALAARERLTRLLGLWGEQTNYQLPKQLPPLPDALTEVSNVEAQAVRERLDVRAALLAEQQAQQALHLVRRLGPLSNVELAVAHNTSFESAEGHRATTRGLELELPIPLFDQGQARSARALAVHAQAQARTRAVAVQARSEAREGWHGWRTAYDLARHYRDQVVPLRRLINDEMLLRFNGMLVSIWDVLGDARQHIHAVNASIEAQRDFWLADTDLQLVLSGTSPGGMTALRSTASPAANEPAGH